MRNNEIAQNGRYQIAVNKWLKSNDGHIISAISKNGKLHLIDPQSGVFIELSNYLSDADLSKGVEFLRTDKLLFRNIINEITM